MTEPRHFHSARKGSGSLRPFPIYPLYTQTVILSLDNPIADCFLFRPRKSRKSAGNAVIPTFPCIGHTDFKGLSNAATNTHPLLPSMGTTRQKNSCRNRLQNGPRLLSRVKAGTHSPSPTGSHTAAYTPKQGPSGRGRYHYPRHVLHVHEHPRAGCQNGVLCRFGILAGRCSRRTQKAFGTAIRLCVSLSRGVAAPLGCVIQ